MSPIPIPAATVIATRPQSGETPISTAPVAPVNPTWESAWPAKVWPRSTRKRAHPAFGAVKVDGRIKDVKARDRGMLNPHWVAEQRKGVLEALGITSAEAYSKRHRFKLPKAP